MAKKNTSDNVNQNVNTANHGRVPPHSDDAEVAVLGAMMIDRIAVSKSVEILQEDAFYHEKHRLIFRAIVRLFERGGTPDFISVGEELKAIDDNKIVDTIFLSNITLATPTSANVEQHARIVQERYLKRLLISTAGQIIMNAYDDSTDALEEIDIAEKHIFEIAEKRLRKSYVGINRLTRDAYEMILKLSQRDQQGLTGVPTGFKELDHLLGGFQKSDLIIIAARPSMGKTALALSIARSAAVVSGIPVAVFSIEMSAMQLVIRLLSSEARIDQQKLRTGRINQEEDRWIVSGLSRLSNAPIYIDDSPMLTIMELRAKCRRLKAEHQVQLIIVDYLQLITAPKSDSREREISLISASLKQIAKELDVPVLALAQLNRSVESRTDKRPMLSDLRESGSIEQDADVVMFVNRPEVYKQMFYDDEHKTPTEGTAELIVGKQRNGPTGTCRVAFQKNYARFENLAYHYEDNPADKGVVPPPEHLPQYDNYNDDDDAF
ncbi:MAG: replicative DNA helicase [Candidatus Kapabacteria bacterium]|nr:replicative DNA helicase [Ignavibacteriota bacterium]MCW5885970.1 replicative DNA helicase [Candidatus Kapabacteria bacterium]